MKDFFDKYVFELVLAITFAIGLGVKWLINYFIKTKFVDKMDEFKTQLQKLEKITKGFQESTKDLVRNVDDVINKVGEFMITIEEFKDNMQKDIDRRFDYWEKRFDKLEEEVKENNKKFSDIKEMHNGVYVNEPNRKIK